MQRLRRIRRDKHLPTDAAVEAVAEASRPLSGKSADFDGLLELIGDARVVLLGEASHGTHEFYAMRAAITQRLIVEKDFSAVCIEGDWPDAYRVDAFVKGRSQDRTPGNALEGFQRFPTWMWRNEVVRDFVGWLRRHNEKSAARPVSFLGLDLYSMFGSISAVLEYLARVDPDAARRARARYACFEHFADDSQAYGYATATKMIDPCESDAIQQLVELRSQAMQYMSRDGRPAADAFFSAEQNARLVLNAEQYYRSMYQGRASSWNLRDKHMAETLEAVHQHLGSTGIPPGVVVWAHNSHLGDARHTEMKRRGELNLGQLVRERHGDGARLIGFSTNTGTVTAAHDWDELGQQMRVRPGLEQSYERLFADVARSTREDRFWFDLTDGTPGTLALGSPRLQRAIGVIYRPETERISHYFEAHLTKQFDAMIHIDETHALRALEPGEIWERGAEEPPETYPRGL
jgi:erythromycin esterase-like protein